MKLFGSKDAQKSPDDEGIDDGRAKPRKKRMLITLSVILLIIIAMRYVFLTIFSKEKRLTKWKTLIKML